MIFILFFVNLLFPAKIILLIGNGMGVSIIGFTKYYFEYVEKRPFYLGKFMEDSDVSVIVNQSYDYLVTDSAAAATAIACGKKTKNGSIGVDEKGNNLKNLFEYAKEKGLSLGLVTTTELSDATPAAFSSHVLARSQKDKVAEQQLNNKINILLGGGKKYFDLKLAKKLGYSVIFKKTDLMRISENQQYLLGVFNEENLNFRISKHPQEPYLKEMVSVALKILNKDKEGFFLMVEGGRIDHAAHDNNPQKLIEEMKDFDDAIKEIIEFKERFPDTKIFLTSDHDTGGLAISKITNEYPDVEDLAQFEKIFWISHHHTATPTLFLGYKEKLPKGILDNTEIFNILLSLIR